MRHQSIDLPTVPALPRIVTLLGLAGLSFSFAILGPRLPAGTVTSCAE